MPASTPTSSPRRTNALPLGAQPWGVTLRTRPAAPRPHCGCSGHMLLLSAATGRLRLSAGLTARSRSIALARQPSPSHWLGGPCLLSGPPRRHCLLLPRVATMLRTFSCMKIGGQTAKIYSSACTHMPHRIPRRSTHRPTGREWLVWLASERDGCPWPSSRRHPLAYLLTWIYLCVCVRFPISGERQFVHRRKGLPPFGVRTA